MDVPSAYQTEIDSLTTKIQALAEELIQKEQDVLTLRDSLEDKEESIRSYAKRNVDLKRKLQEPGKTIGGNVYFLWQNF